MNVNSAWVYVGKVAILGIALGPETSKFWRCHFSLCKSIDFFVSGGSFLGAQTGGGGSRSSKIRVERQRCNPYFYRSGGPGDRMFADPAFPEVLFLSGRRS